jgi:hypothetical protein
MLTKFLDWAAEPPDRSREKREKRPRTALERWLTSVMICVVAVVGGQTLLSGMSEGYCWIWPGIGTRFAPDYTAWGFDSVQPGMTRSDVERLIGLPLGQSLQRGTRPFGDLQAGDELWQYGSDSSALSGDWAWLSREVVFRRGVVSHKVYWTYHD